MKPHPKLRKTIKWGGAAVTVLLVVVWVGSIWWDVSWGSRRNGFGDVGAGGFGILYHSAKKSDSMITGWRLSEVDDLANMRWWFHVTALNPSPQTYFYMLTIPLWWPVLVVLSATALAWRLDTLARRRENLNLCPKCNYDRTGILQDAKCPECGVGGAAPVGVDV